MAITTAPTTDPSEVDPTRPVPGGGDRFADEARRFGPTGSKIPTGATEAAARAALGIPAEAREVMVVGESTHWDPNWLLTSEEYFRLRVKRTIDAAIAECLADPQRVYSVECVFFVKMYWERMPHRHHELRTLVNEGRIRFTGSGITTPDTFLPGHEALLRDLLVGQEWLAAHGMDQEPRLLYLPDSFGHSPGLPAILEAAGYDRVAFTRTDGMYFAGAEWEPATNYPRAGSSAARLLLDDRTLDFVWRGPGGAEVLAHWNAFGYGHGDMIAAKGLSRWMGAPIFVGDRRDDHVAARIERYRDDLAAVARTPYLYLQLGFDFVAPVKDLGGLVGRWNDSHFARTGLWLVNAAMDDYLTLVDFHRPDLPVIDFDANPYWTGFYAARPNLKRDCKELLDDLVLAETAAVAIGARDADPEVVLDVEAALAPVWPVAVVTNHHDFVTGTSPDRVYAKEQQPWVDESQARVRPVIDQLARAAGQSSSSSSSSSCSSLSSSSAAVAYDDLAGPVAVPRWRRDGEVIEVVTDVLRVRIDGSRGGCLTSVVDLDGGDELLRGLSNDLVAYEDTGGLWRMGHEFRGGTFRRVDAMSERPARLIVSERDGAVEIAAVGLLDGRPARRWVTLRTGERSIGFRTQVGCDDRRMATTCFHTTRHDPALLMDQPGGFVGRPAQRQYDPTFWPLHNVVLVHDTASPAASGPARPMALAVAAPTSVHAGSDGAVELTVARNATKETAWGWAPLIGHPAKGVERGEVISDYVVWFPTGTDADAPALDAFAAGLRPQFRRDPPALAAVRAAAAGAVHIDREDVRVLAVKPADRGDGIVVRLYAPSPIGQQLTLRLGPAEAADSDPSTTSTRVATAWRADARERDRHELVVRDGGAMVTMDATLVTVRLIPAP